MLVKIARDFTTKPGGRYIEEGAYSGELFRDRLVYPALLKVLKQNQRLVIDFDGCYGFETSFLEEAFGGMVRKYGIIGLLKSITLVSTEDETIPGLISKYVNAEEKKQRHLKQHALMLSEHLDETMMQ